MLNYAPYMIGGNLLTVHLAQNQVNCSILVKYGMVQCHPHVSSLEKKLELEILNKI